jgi:hypothetical protein
MYELAKNPEEFERINKLGALTAAREIGKIEAKLPDLSSDKETKKITTKAPAPLKPVGGGSTGTTVPLDELDYQAYKAARKKQGAK